MRRIKSVEIIRTLRRDIDDFAHTLTPCHQLDRSLTTMKSAREVQGHLPLDLIFGNVGEFGHKTSARIIDQRINPAVIAGNPGEGLRDCSTAGQVRHNARKGRNSSSPTTCIPSAIRRATIARPLPPAAPVTTAILRILFPCEIFHITLSPKQTA